MPQKRSRQKNFSYMTKIWSAFSLSLITLFSAGCAQKNQAFSTAYKYQDPNSGEEVDLRPTDYFEDARMTSQNIEIGDAKIKIDKNTGDVQFKVSTQFKEGGREEHILKGKLDGNKTIVLKEENSNNKPGTSTSRVVKAQLKCFSLDKSEASSQVQTPHADSSAVSDCSEPAINVFVNTSPTAIIKKQFGAIADAEVAAADSNSNPQAEDAQIAVPVRNGTITLPDPGPEFFDDFKPVMVPSETQPEAVAFINYNPKTQEDSNGPDANILRYPPDTPTQKPDPKKGKGAQITCMPLGPELPLASEYFRSSPNSNLEKLMKEKEMAPVPPYYFPALDFGFYDGGTAINASTKIKKEISVPGSKKKKFVFVNGSIRCDGTFLPKEGYAYERYLLAPKAFGTGFLVKFIYDFTQIFYFNNQSCGKFAIGNLSKKGGGVLRPHVSHQNGLDVDVNYLKNSVCDAKLFKFLASIRVPDEYNRTPFGQQPRAVDKILVGYSEFIKIKNALKKINATERIEKRFLDKEGLTELDRETLDMLQIDSKENPNNPLNHSTHFHMRLKCPSTHEGCDEMK